MDSGGGGGASHKAASGSAPSGAAAANPTAMLSALMSTRAKLQEELRSIERQVRSYTLFPVSFAPLSLSLLELGFCIGDHGFVAYMFRWQGLAIAQHANEWCEFTLLRMVVKLELWIPVVA